MKIRLIKKFAQFVNGIDLSAVNEGEVLELSNREATLLVLEGWATPISDSAPRARADDKPRRSRTPKSIRR